MKSRSCQNLNDIFDKVVKIILEAEVDVLLQCEMTYLANPGLISPPNCPQHNLDTADE